MIVPRLSTFLLCLILTTHAWGKVLLHWTSPSVPPAKSLGTNELVVPWTPDSSAFVETARKQGYRVFLQATPEQIPAIAGSVKTDGIIVEIPTPQLPQADAILQKLRSTHPNLTFLLLDPNGKQPQMKGTMVIKKDGILEITSPTAQPWIDSNIPLVRFEQGFRPGQVPIYTFQWELPDPLQKKQGPSAADYSLAIAEAACLHADLILNLPDELQKALAANDQAAWNLWKQVQLDLAFAAQVDPTSLPEANIGIVTDTYDNAYEPMNMMSRHNIPFRVLPAGTLTPRSLADLRMLLVFTMTNPQAVGEIANFAAAGGIAVLIGQKGFFPWHTAAANRTAQNAVTYRVGKGRVIELSEPVTDPETFAQDIRRLMSNRDVLISLWNALTTIGIPYRNPGSGTFAVDLVNYSADPLRVQIRLKGSFRSIRYESPDHGCCQPLTSVHHDGFTEFVVPSLSTAGRVHMTGSAR